MGLTRNPAGSINVAMYQPVSYQPPRLPPPDMLAQASAFYQAIRTRRSIRDFAPDPIPMPVIEEALRAAGTAPNGANLQPWHFAVVTAPSLKRRIREAAEEEERAFYEQRAPQEWLDTLRPLGTNADKPFLESAPVLIAIFQANRVETANGTQQRTYYPKESVGIATGFLIAALHLAGVSTLTHTPSPMGFLNEILDRPPTEKPFLLLVCGYPAKGCTVPELSKKALSEIASFHQG